MTDDEVARRQPHGGALLNGGVRGNRGGSGAPPSLIRLRCRESFLSRISIAERVADDERSAPRDRLKALELLARLGGVDNAAVTDQEARVAELRASGVPKVEAEILSLRDE